MARQERQPVSVTTRLEFSGIEKPDFPSPLIQLWEIAEKGPIIGEKFTLRFERTIGHRNNPQEVIIDVDRADGKYVASYHVNEQGLSDFNYEGAQAAEGLPDITSEPENLTEQEKARIYMGDAVKVLDFVREIPTQANNAEQSTSLTPQ